MGSPLVQSIAIGLLPPRMTSIDLAAAADHAVAVVHTGYRSDPTIELTWALILASARNIVTENSSIRSGRWQQTVGADQREQALISVLKKRQIAGAAIDAFDIEPLPPSHPFRTLDNELATPHIGYVSRGLYRTFYENTVANIRAWLDPT